MAGPLFASTRERRLWLWTLAAVTALYSTLGSAGTLAGVLRSRGPLEEIVMAGMVLVAATIVTQGLKARPGGAEIV